MDWSKFTESGISNEPDFVGTIVKVGPIVKIGAETATVLQFLPGEDEVNFTDVMQSLGADMGRVPLEARVKTALVQMHLDPAVIQGCFVHGKNEEYNGMSVYAVRIKEQTSRYAGLVYMRVK